MNLLPCDDVLSDLLSLCVSTLQDARSRLYFGLVILLRLNFLLFLLFRLRTFLLLLTQTTFVTISMCFTAR